jgi:MFS family permease
MKDRLGKVFYGWWIVAAGAILMAFSYGAWYYAYGAFFTPISTEFGWSRAKTSLAFSLSGGEGGLEGLITGPICDRFGPRFVVRAGWALAALGFLLMSRINSFWMFMVIYILFVSLGMNAGQMLPLTASVTQWFDKKRGLALGFLLAGGAIVGSLLLQGTARLIADYGWRMANVILGIVALVLGLGLSFILKPHGPEHYGLRMDGKKTEAAEDVAKSASAEVVEKDIGLSEGFSLKEALKTQAFWVMVIAFSFSRMALNAIVVHEIPFIEDMGISKVLAAAAMGGMTLMSSPGRLLGGWLCDKWNLKYLYFVSAIIQAGGLFIFSRATAMSWVWTFVVVYGFGYGIWISLGPALRAQYFGRKAYGAVYGYMNFFTTVGAIAGPYFAGWVFDTTHSYTSAFFIIGGSLVVSAVVILFVKNPMKNKLQQSPVSI